MTNLVKNRSVIQPGEEDKIRKVYNLQTYRQDDGQQAIRKANFSFQLSAQVRSKGEGKRIKSNSINYRNRWSLLI